MQTVHFIHNETFYVCSTIYSSVLEQKINPNSLIASKGVSLLHLIIGHHSENFAFKVTKFFLRCGGGDPNVQSSDGVTPTHVAAGWGRNRILHLLLVNGGDPWVLDDEKRNAFNYAFEEQEWNTIEMLHYFQQMHSAINAKQMMERPKISFDLENMLLHKKEEILAYASNKISKKSKMTQTYNYFYDSPSSPVQDKIKYFEPNQNTLLELNYWKKPEKFNAGWSKNAYQTSCEVVVPCDPDKELKNEKNKKQTFISSIHINTSPKTLNSNPPKCVSNSPPLDIRSQLFVELQEAVSRRSRQKVLRQGSKTNLSTSFVEYCKSNSMIISNVNLGEKEKENCQVDSTDLEDRDTDLNDMLKNMSDKIMPVMDESKISKEETEKKIDLCTSESDWTNNCSSSEGESSVQKPELQNIQTFIIPQNNSVENTSLYLTPYNSNLSSDFINNKTKENNSNASFVSFSEEYKSGDVTKDVILSDKNVLVTPTTR